MGMGAPLPDGLPLVVITALETGALMTSFSEDVINHVVVKDKGAISYLVRALEDSVSALKIAVETGDINDLMGRKQ